MKSSVPTGFVKGIGIVVALMAIATLSHVTASTVGFNPVLAEGIGGGLVLGATFHYFFRKMRAWSPLVDADSVNRLRFDEPKTATVTSPPYDGEQRDVFAIEMGESNGHPFKVWVDSDDGEEHHPYYASGVEFDIEEFKE